MKTSKSHIAKKEATTESFPLDFYSKAFKLLAYLYKSGPEQTTTLPNPEGEITVKEETRYPFQSRIVDLKLRRIQDQRATEQVESSQVFSNSYKKYKNLIKKNEDDIISVFEPEQAVRPDIPLYLKNVQKEREEDLWKYRRKKRPNPISMKEIEKEYSKRLENSKKIGVNRAKHRFYSYNNSNNNQVEAMHVNTENEYDD